MNAESVEIARRTRVWESAPRVVAEWMIIEKKGKRRDQEKQPIYRCARCGTFPGWHGYNNPLHFVDPGPGIICKNCYVFGDRCETSGCNEVAVLPGVCRDCLMGGDYMDKEETLHNIVWGKSSSYIAPEDVAPAMPSGAFYLEMRESAKKMFRSGFWQRRKFGSMGVERWEKRK